MQKNVTYRNKGNIQNGSNDSANRSWNLTRPKSWGEFQSGLKTFQPIKRPITTTKCNGNQQFLVNEAVSREKRSTTEAKDEQSVKVILPRKEAQNKEMGRKPTRPLSEILLSPSIIKFNAPQPLKLLKLSTGGTSDEEDTKNPFQMSNDRAENVDDPSLDFEKALEGSINTSQDRSSDQSLTDINCRNDASGFDTLIVQQPKGLAGSSINGTNSNDLLRKQQRWEVKDASKSEDAFEIDFSSEQSAYDDGYSSRKQIESDINNINSIVENLELASEEITETKTDSDTSSVIDTGFDSFGEAGNSQFSIDVAEVCFEESNMQKVGKSRLSVTKGIPTPLRACYLNTYEINSDHGNTSRDYSSLSRTSGSSMSASISEDENMSGFLSLDNSLHSLDNSNQVSSPVMNTANGNMITEMYKTSAQLNLKIFERSSLAPKKKNAINQEKKAKQAGAESNNYVEEKIKITLKEWKDDIDAPTIVKNTSADVNKDYRSHGTWPRHANRSKRKRNQAEADELLRKFRETSEIYRARFREIYAETRRKIEETMFGLRVAVARSGYSSKYYNTDKAHIT